ncbi:hypothetical protein [Amycolatopsis albispora]|uniref:ABC transporter permease n=1 Tax=Amycolatopsis albispora TaxID=1804986 RepID=A0A344L4Z7_9PSEU|nr:hypothetical protein [Amycolatopsis albispora]AXB43121.1 hypothetical protein A4R43_11635 [Amycolatopsis albispora]
MNLLASERIKLLSTRSPWWCLVAAFVLVVGTAGLMAAAGDSELTVPATQNGTKLALAVVVVLAALAVTTEYRFGTIRATFQAEPARGPALAAKAVVVAVAAGLAGLLAGPAAWLTAELLAPDRTAALAAGGDWRTVLGSGPLYAVSAVVAVAVGILLRQTAGALALLLVWVLQGEMLLGLIPEFGPAVRDWLPFRAGAQFVSADGGPLGHWGSLGYFATFAVALLAIAISVAKRRDA